MDPLADQYTFYHPGFNFRGTDVGAFLGLRQLDKLPRFVKEPARGLPRSVQTGPIVLWTWRPSGSRYFARHTGPRAPSCR